MQTCLDQHGHPITVGDSGIFILQEIEEQNATVLEISDTGTVTLRNNESSDTISIHCTNLYRIYGSQVGSIAVQYDDLPKALADEAIKRAGPLPDVSDIRFIVTAIVTKLT